MSFADWILEHGDYLVFVIFFGAYLLFGVLERLVPSRTDDQQRRERWPANLGLTISNLIVLSVLPISLVSASRWTEAQQWFDGAYRGKLVLVSNVTFGEAKPMPVVNVQAVWFGERPYVITTEGNRYYKGAFLDNGWMIKDIVDGRILLAKDGETLALVYRQ